MKLLLLVLTLSFLTSCTMSSKPLTAQERHSDLDWVFATVERNYAPLDYKRQNLGVKLEDIKAECYEASKNNQTNDEFRALVFKCIAKLQDTHTIPVQQGWAGPNKASVAYLGFLTDRTKHTEQVGKEKVTTDALIVTDLMASVKNTDFPIKKNDKIVAINGKPVAEVLLEEIIPYRSLGQAESNLTYAASVYPVRSSLNSPIPVADDVVLTIYRSSAKPPKYEVTLPWVKKDLFTFTKEQIDAKKRRLAEKAKTPTENDVNKDPVADDDSQNQETVNADKEYKTTGSTSATRFNFKNKFYKVNALGLNNYVGENFMTSLLTALSGDARDYLAVTFNYFEVNLALFKAQSTSVDNEEEEEKLGRKIPETAVILKNDSFLAYVNNVNGESVGYIRVPTFQITADDVGKFANAVSSFNNLKVSKLIIDMLDNHGGDAIQGLHLANLLKPEGVEYPKIQLALNDKWLDVFAKTETETIDDDIVSTWAGRVNRVLQADVKTGKRLSSPISFKELDPYVNNGPRQKVSLPKETKIVLLVNEMCISMCDLFASVFKDNNLGIILGQKTNGAGGNVDMHAGAPSSGIMLRQTESLILKSNGDYIENKGIEPDVVFDTVADKSAKYKGVIEKAGEILTKGLNPTPQIATKIENAPIN